MLRLTSLRRSDEDLTSYLFDVWKPSNFADRPTCGDTRAWLATAMQDDASNGDKEGGGGVKNLRTIVQNMEFRSSAPPRAMDQ